MGVGTVNPYVVPNNPIHLLNHRLTVFAFLLDCRVVIMQESFDLLRILFQVLPSVVTLFRVLY